MRATASGSTPPRKRAPRTRRNAPAVRPARAGDPVTSGPRPSVRCASVNVSYSTTPPGVSGIAKRGKEIALQVAGHDDKLKPSRGSGNTVRSATPARARHDLVSQPAHARRERHRASDPRRRRETRAAASDAAVPPATHGDIERSRGDGQSGRERRRTTSTMKGEGGSSGTIGHTDCLAQALLTAVGIGFSVSSRRSSSV